MAIVRAEDGGRVNHDGQSLASIDAKLITKSNVITLASANGLPKIP